MAEYLLGRGERGAVSVLAVWATLGLLVLTMAALQVSVLIRLRHDVAAAADLAALAAARASMEGNDGCQAARTIAQRNGARVKSCRMDYAVATITAGAETQAWWKWRFAVQAQARAAPRSYVEQSP